MNCALLWVKRTADRGQVNFSLVVVSARALSTSGVWSSCDVEESVDQKRVDLQIAGVVPKPVARDPEKAFDKGLKLREKGIIARTAATHLQRARRTGKLDRRRESGRPEFLI